MYRATVQDAFLQLVKTTASKQLESESSGLQSKGCSAAISRRAKIEAMDRKKVTFSAECHLFRVHTISYNSAQR